MTFMYWLQEGSGRHRSRWEGTNVRLWPIAAPCDSLAARRNCGIGSQPIALRRRDAAAYRVRAGCALFYPGPL